MPREILFEGDGPDDVFRVVSSYWAWLQETRIPKLLLYAKPGVIIKKAVVAELKAAVPRLDVVYIGKGPHYIQEDEPDAIGQALSDWLGARLNGNHQNQQRRLHIAM